MEVLKISMLGIAAVVLATQLKGEKSEYSILIILAAAAVLFTFGLSQMAGILNVLKKLELSAAAGKSYWQILVKMIGITYIAEFASSICKDAGYQAISSQIEIFGKLSILLVGMPVLITLLETVESFLR